MKKIQNRFANILNQINDTNKIWKVVKKIRSEIMFLRVCDSSHSKVLFTDTDIQLNMRAFEEEIQINSTRVISENMTDNQLKEAAQMFIYLNFCPDSLNPWFLFYKELFENKSPNVIALTLNRILKGNISDEIDDLKKIAKTLLNELTSLLSLQYQYIGDMSKLRKEESAEDGLLSEGFNVYSLFLSHIFDVLCLCYLDVVRISNHPVHALDEDGNLSPSAFIPFCAFGSNMSSMGVEIEQFDVPVCNSFQATILNDQLCYEVDLNRFSIKSNIKNELRSGFSFIMDYNEDREVILTESVNNEEKYHNMMSQIIKSDDDRSATIYLNTIGR